MKQTAFLVAAVVLLAGCTSPDAGSEAPDAFPAPAFAAADLDGELHDLADARGKAVLLNVWATWCKSCAHELPLIDDLYQDYADRGLEVWAVSIDDRWSTDSVREYTESLNLTFLVLHDPDGQTVTPAFRNLGAPDTFLIDADGYIVDRWKGEWDPSTPENRARVEAALPA